MSGARTTRSNRAGAPLLAGVEDAGPPPYAEALTSGTVTLGEALANPERYLLRGNVWYALNAPELLVDAHPQHTLAGVFGLSAAAVVEQLREEGLFGQGRNVATLAERLAPCRTTPGPLHIGGSRFSFNSHKYRYAALTWSRGPR